MFGRLKRVLAAISQQIGRLPYREGSVAVEGAIWLPVLILAAIMLIDIVRYLETTAQIDSVAMAVADMVTRSTELRDQPDFTTVSDSKDLGMYFLAGNEIARPMNLAAEGRIIVSLITTSNNSFLVNWRRSGPYGLSASSRMLEIPDLPANVTFIVSEVFFRYGPILLNWTRLMPSSDAIIYRRAIFRPRLTTLTSLKPAS